MLVKSLLSDEGFGALYKGLTASISRQLLYSSLIFGIYPQIKQMMASEKDFPLYKRIIASTIASTIGSFVGSPTDMVLIRMQSGNRLGYRNIFHGIFKTYQLDGINGVFRGCRPTTFRGIIVNVAQIVTYDQIKQLLLDTRYFPDDSIKTHLTASTLSGLLSAVLASPVDVIKTRMIYSDSYTGIYDTASKIFRNEGFGGFYKGLVMNASRLVPVTILTFVFYEQIYKMFVSVKQMYK